MKLTVVTSNDGKFREFSDALFSSRTELVRSTLSYPELQSASLEEVVRFGLDWLSARVEGEFVIDDSGLFIDALGGFPGVYSAYVAKTIGLEGVLKLMEGREDRSAVFVTKLGLFFGGGTHIFSGECSGAITEAAKGKGGFGYDPIFRPEGSGTTFAQMTPEEKNTISHRGQALRMLNEFLASHAQEATTNENRK